ncbi:hypothetical protein ACLOJK_037254 [Asimina triloba]
MDDHGLPLPGVPTTSPRGELEGRPCSEASGPSLGTCSSTEGLPTLVLRRPGYRAWSEERLKKRKHLIKGLAFSCKEARRSNLFVTSPEALVDPISLRSVPLPILVMNIGADTTSPTLVLESKTSEVSERLPSTLPVNNSSIDDLPPTLKILGDFLSIQSSGIKEWAGKWMLLEYLPNVWKELSNLEERVCLIDECASRAKYHYHVLGKHARLLVERSPVEGMTEGERRFFFQLLKISRRVNQAEALREEAEMAILELRSVLDATRAKLDEARDDAEGVSLAK